MARTEAFSIFTNLDPETKDKLGEIYGGLIENVQKKAISEQIKNKKYSGEPTSGSIEINRFANATSKAYGTARQNGYADKLVNKPVVINVDTREEIITEVNKTDLDLHGLPSIAEMEQANQVNQMVAKLDRKFFECAEAGGTTFNMTGNTIVEKLESLILSLETTTNEFVDGIDRNMLVLTVKPHIYSAIKTHINETTNSLNEVKPAEFFGVRIYSNHRQTKDVICMLDGAVGQLVLVNEYGLEKIPMSNDFAMPLFYSYGTKVVTPDLIKYANFTAENNNNESNNTTPNNPNILVDDDNENNDVDLNSKTKEELLAYASELGVTGVSSSNTKAEIIEAIQAKLAENQ